jgi:hypothetical protein
MPHPRPTSRSTLTLYFLVLLLLGLPACVTENPRHRDIPAPPQAARPSRLVLSVGRFLEDSDSNGYGDLMTVSVYLFDERYPHAPISTPGAMQFVLRSPAGKDLRTWSFSHSQTSAALTNLPAGPGFTFRLSLRDHGSDQLPGMTAELFAIFITPNGESVQSNVPVRVGKSG